MKASTLWIYLFFSATALAQVNLDQPITVSHSDKVFKSAADPKVAYLFPVALNRTSIATVTEGDGYYNARFEIGQKMDDLARVKTEMESAGLKDLQIRFLKPLNTKVVPDSGTDIPAKFEPRLTALGDIDLYGSTQFSLQVNKRWRWFHKPEGQELLETLFGHTGVDHVGTLYYEFDAIVGGQPQLGRTAIAIFVGSQSFDLKMLENNSNMLFYFQNEIPQPLILKDSESFCWESVKPGQFCVRQK